MGLPLFARLVAQQQSGAPRVERVTPYGRVAFLTLFRSSERNGLNALYREHGGWGEVARAGVTVKDVPGYHFGMLRHPDFPSVVLGEPKRNNPETSATTR